MLGKVWSDKNGELVGAMLFDYMELFEINVGEDFEFVLLKALTLEFDFGGKDCLRLGHL